MKIRITMQAPFGRLRGQAAENRREKTYDLVKGKK